MTVYEWIFIGCLCLLAVGIIIQQIRDRRRDARGVPPFPLDPTLRSDSTGCRGPSNDGTDGGGGFD